MHLNRMVENLSQEGVTVPVRGVRCISFLTATYTKLMGYCPREGSEMHLSRPFLIER